MKKGSMKTFINKMIDGTKQNSPEILTGLAVVGIVTTAVLAAKAGIKAKEVLERRKNDISELEAEKLPKEKEEKEKKDINKEVVKDVAIAVAPVVVMGGMTIACAIGSNRISAKRVKVLSAAYALAEKGLRELTEKSQDILGEKKFAQIRDSIVKDKVANETSDTVPNFVLLPGEVLCQDLYTHKYFRSNADKINSAILELSSDCRDELYVSLNDFYRLIDSPDLDESPMGRDVGWNVDVLMHGKLPIRTTAILVNNQPCICIDYYVEPRHDFRNLM